MKKYNWVFLLSIIYVIGVIYYRLEIGLPSILAVIPCIVCSLYINLVVLHKLYP
jgi:hypothetical protein